MKAWYRIPLQLLTTGLVGLVAMTAVITGGYFYVEPSLPEAEELRDVRLAVPSRIFSRDGRLIQQYGEQKRTPASYDEIPQDLINAIVAAEDDSFFEHSGIDFLSTIRAVLNYGISFVTSSDGRVAGGSTITQQIVRTTNLLGRDYALGRKVKEIYLAYRIEAEFSKEEILRLYLNTYEFGHRSFGIVSAARTYFDKELDQLTLSEIAVIAGIPTAPSLNNPYTSPERAANRRGYVLRRMHELSYISAAEREAALAEPIFSQYFDVAVELSAGYVAAEAYAWCQQKFGKLACDTEGLKITTTIDSRLQRAANAALPNTLGSYDRDHGYRGPVGRVDLEALFDSAQASESSTAAALDELLIDYPNQFDFETAVVVAVNEIFADVYLESVGFVSLGFDSVSWARKYINDDNQGAFPKSVSDVLTPGDIVRLGRTAEGALELGQPPDVEGALVALDPMDGAVVSLVGGYSFQRSAFNRATQATRQPGSSFKPFFYMSALANGYTLAKIVNDAPLVFCGVELEECRPVTNYDGKYLGEVPMRFALENSLNAAADRIVRDISPRSSIRYLERFGFSDTALPNNASLALGSGVVTPLELAGAYSILANGGYAVGITQPDSGRISPYFIQRVETAEGEVLYDASLSVKTVCLESEESADDQASNQDDVLIERSSELFPPLRCAEQVESPQRIFLITDVLKDVIKTGSGRRTQREPSLQRRNDLAGKTGTTSGPRDAWFAGFNADIVTVVRVGFDVDTRDLGVGEQGGVTAIPAWINFMRVALDGMPDHSLPRPLGIEERRINPETGLLAADCNGDAEFEFFMVDNVPQRESDSACFAADPLSTTPDRNPNSGSLFQ